MRHNQIAIFITAVLCILLIILLLLLFTGCSTREDKPVYMKRYELVQRDEYGSIVVYTMRDTKTKCEYAVFRAGYAMDVVEVTP